MKDFTNKEAIDMMAAVITELEDRKRQIEQLAPKAHAYDTVTQILGLIPRQSTGGMAPDIIWQLKRRLRELKDGDKPEGVVT